MIAIFMMASSAPLYSQSGSSTSQQSARPSAQHVAPTAVEDYRDLWQRGDYAAALHELNEMIMTMSRGVPPQYLFDRAELHFRTGRLDFAVRDMEILSRQIAAPVYTLRLAEYYRSVGKQRLFEESLADAARQAENRWFYGAYEDNVLAMARIQDLRGENPRTILRTILDPLIQRRPDFPGGYVGAGDLALSKDDYGLAADYYEKALEIDAVDQDALAGLIWCYLRSDDPRYESTLETLRQLNPNHPTVFEVDVELKLRTGSYEDALQRTEAGLAVNPTHSRLLASKAAALFFLNRTEAMERVFRQALDINPLNAEVYRLPGLMASSRVRNVDAVDFLQKALAIDPSDHESEALLGFALLNLGRDEEGRERLEQAFANDPYDVRVFNMLKVLDALEQFVTIEEGDFRLSLPASEADILAEDAFELLIESQRVLGEKYAVEFQAPIVVQMFDHHDDFMVRTLGFPGAVGYLGICTGQLITMDSPSARPPGEVNWRRVLWHEFGHIVTLQKTRNRMPRWLSEGISGFEERNRDPAWGERAAVEYKKIVATEGLPRLRHLERYFTTPKSPLYLNYGYFVSAEFIDFYTEAYGFPALNLALERIGEGEPTESALLEAAGTTAENLDSSFAEHLKQRYLKFDNLPEIGETRGRTISVMDEGTSVTLKSQEWAEGRSPFTDAMTSGVKALEEGRWDQAEIQLKRAHELYPEYQGADAPLRLLIDLYDRLGRSPELEAALREQIGSNATDLSAYSRYVRMLERQGKWDEMAMTAEKAFGIDPFSAPMHQARMRAAVELGQTETALKELRYLTRLDAPHSADYELRRVQLLIAAERWEEAHDEVFALLERLPYFWEAQEALLKIVERNEAVVTSAPGPGEATHERIEVAGR